MAALASLAALAMQACRPRGEIVIGFVASMSGMDYMLGVEGRNAAMLFVDRLNGEGGIGGRTLRLEVRDLASDDSRAPEVAAGLAAAGVEAVVGFYSSSSALAAIPVLEEAGVPIISPTSTSDALSGKADCFYRTIMSTARDPEALAASMRQAGHRRVLFIAAAYNVPYYQTYLQGLAPLVDIAGTFFYQKLDEVDYGAIAELGAGDGYDSVMIVAGSLDTGTIAQELALRGLLAPLYLSGWAGNDDVITYGGAAVEGATMVHQVDPALVRDLPLSAAYRAAFGEEPGYGAIETWDSMLFLVEALRASGPVPGRLAAAIGAVRSFTGTAGTIGIDEYGDASRPLYMKRIIDGAFVVTGAVN